MFTHEGSEKENEMYMSRDVDYYFTKFGRLIHKTTGKSFQWKNQSHYEDVANYVQRYVVKELEKRGFEEVRVPNTKKKQKGEEETEIYVYNGKEKETSPVKAEKEKVLVLLQGAGKVPPGMWSRRVCINDNLKKGSMLPIIDEAVKKGYDAIYVLNPNKEHESFSPKDKAYAHTMRVWDNFLKKHENVYVIAHSFGGACFCVLLNKRSEEVVKKITKVAFTDSVHGHPAFVLDWRLTKSQKNWMMKKVRNWIRSKESVGKYMGKKKGVPCYSAGHKEHEYTTYTATHKIWEYFESDI